jgi:2-amino-4-hydroxy-6-hydroxymethyldihydropteridine diphosphokinase
MARVYISIGSNIEPLHHIRTSLTHLQHQFGPLILSSVYESQAIGFKGDNFYNLVAGFDTSMTLYQVVDILRYIEQMNGRQRQSKRFSARTLDLDLLLYDDLILKADNLEIPRDEISQYAFVLLPLAEIAPTARHPLTGQRYTDMLKQFNHSEQPLWRINVNVNP